MATSASVNWEVSRDDIIKAAYRKVLVDEDFTPTTNQTNNAALLLNGIVKSWNAALGMPLWAMNYAFLLPFTDSYATNIITGHVTASYVHTTVLTAASSGASTINLTSVTSVANGYYIGIELDSNDMQWTTVNGAPSGQTVTLTAALTGNVAAGNHVYVYQNKLSKPLRVIQAYTVQGSVGESQSDIPVRIITPEEFFSFSNKNTEQYPLNLSYEAYTANGGFRIWPRFSNGERVVVFRYHRQLEDFDASGDTPDFPQEYFLPLVYELACSLAPDYALSGERYAILRREADKWLEKVANNDYEEGSIYFQPNQTYSGS